MLNYFQSFNRLKDEKKITMKGKLVQIPILWKDFRIGNKQELWEMHDPFYKEEFSFLFNNFLFFPLKFIKKRNGKKIKIASFTFVNGSLRGNGSFLKTKGNSRHR